MRRIPEASAALLAMACTVAAAADAKPRGTLDELRPKGETVVQADHLEFEQGGAMLYTGHVRLVSDTLTLSGDRLEVHQFPGKQFEANVTGAPAHLEHAAATGEKGELPAINAQASTLHYDTRTGTIDIHGQAVLTRDKDEIAGENIRYNVPARRIEAAGGPGGQVRMVLQPPPDKKGADKK